MIFADCQFLESGMHPDKEIPGNLLTSERCMQELQAGKPSTQGKKATPLVPSELRKGLPLRFLGSAALQSEAVAKGKTRPIPEGNLHIVDNPVSTSYNNLNFQVDAIVHTISFANILEAPEPAISTSATATLSNCRHSSKLLCLLQLHLAVY